LRGLSERGGRQFSLSIVACATTNSPPKPDDHYASPLRSPS